MTLVSPDPTKTAMNATAAPPGAPQAGLPVRQVRPDDPSHVIRKGQWIMGGFFVIFLGVAAFAPLSSAAVSQGEVTVRGNVQTLEAPQGGRIERLRVREGERVQRNQVLLEIEDELPQGRLQVLMANWNALKAQESRLLAERSGAPQPLLQQAAVGPSVSSGVVTPNEQFLFEQRMREAQLEQQVFEAQMRQLELAAASNTRQAEASSLQIRLTGEELAGVQRLRRQGFAPVTRVRALQARVAELQQQREQYLQAALQARQNLGETRLQLQRAQTGRLNVVTEQLNATQLRLTELAPQVQAAQRSVRLTQVRAPAAGQVVGLRVFTVGAVVTEGERLLDVVPAGAPLIVQARIAPKDRDDVRAGAVAEVRFTTLSARRDRSVPAVVETVSEESLQDQGSGGAYYLANLRLDPAEVRRAGLQMTPGTPVQVLVRARERTMLQYFVEPLTDQLSRAMRED